MMEEIEMIGPGSIALIVGAALVIFGPKKLPELGRAAGDTLREFKNATKDMIRRNQTRRPAPVTEISMSLTGHLKELRTRLLIILLSFFLAFFVGLFVSKPLILFLQKDDLPKEVILYVFKVTNAFQIYIEMTFIIGLVLVFPVILYQLWFFVKLGLHASEQRITLRYIPITFLLFLCGIVFSYVITFPFILKFMFQFAAELGVEKTIGLATYF